MTELMKRYEAETGERATFVYTWIDNEGEEKHGDITTGGFDVWAIREAERLNEENARLKDQLRWRPVSEKPEKANMYFAKVRLYVGCEKLTTKIVYFDGERFLLTDVVKWLPIPPAQEGETIC